MAERKDENIFERLIRMDAEIDEEVAREGNQLTDTEWRELTRINRMFEDVGDIRLALTHRMYVSLTNKLRIAKYAGIGLTVGGEILHRVGGSIKSDNLSGVGRHLRNFGFLASGLSYMGQTFCDFYARDANVELVYREETGKRL